MTNIFVEDNLVLELTAQKHAPGLFNAVDSNRLHLSEFLPWVANMQSVADFNHYIQHCETLYELKTDISFVIISNHKIAGRIGIHHIHTQNKTGAIGYWITKEFEGRGIMDKCCRALIQYGFEQMNLHRIEIKAAVGNLRSQAIPQKLGFTKEGILRQAEFVNNGFLDIVLYSMLVHEWNTRQPFS
jgi:ribosomal-protein-serine acetyltransferase